MVQALGIWLPLLFAIVLLAVLARRLALPAPLLIVFAGLILSLLPGMPRIELHPDLVLYCILPPLIFEGAVTSSWSAFRHNMRPILSLAIGLVLFTTLLVAAATRYLLPGFNWPAAFALGAIVSPPDDVAAIAVLHRMHIPSRLITIIEGEGLVNDATSLTLLRLATLSAFSGIVTPWHGALFFIADVTGEIGYGLLVGWIFRQVMDRLKDSEDASHEIALTLIVPFAAYLPAERLGGSGVLATVAAGLFLSTQFPRFIPAKTRLAAAPFWQMVTFLLNNFLFLLLGLQMRSVMNDVTGMPLGSLLIYAAAISLLVILVRFVWVFPATYLPRAFSAELRKRRPHAPWQQTFIVAWSGMRGAISLAAALSLPLLVNGRQPFPDRNLIIFLTFSVILATLVLQGLTLPFLVRWLGVGRQATKEREAIGQLELKARAETIQAGLAWLEETASEKELPGDIIEPLRRHYEHRLASLDRHLQARGDDRVIHLARQEQELRHGMLEAEQRKLFELRDQGKISDELLRRIEHTIDLDRERLG